MRFYRVHPRGESPATTLDPRRPDGWVASDESYETQPYGTSATLTLEDLSAYVSSYGMALQRGDKILELVGRLSPDRDRDHYAVRVLVDSYCVLGEAIPWQRVYQMTPNDVLDAIEDGVVLRASEREWMIGRLSEGWIYEFHPMDRHEVVAWVAQ